MSDNQGGEDVTQVQWNYQASITIGTKQAHQQFEIARGVWKPPGVTP